jgi:Na+-driven multidrug efflux pump
MQMIYARMVVSFSVAAYAAHQIGLNIESISWLPGLGFAQAATAMVGQNLGARLPRKAKRVGYQSSLVAINIYDGVGRLLSGCARAMGTSFHLRRGGYKIGSNLLLRYRFFATAIGRGDGFFGGIARRRQYRFVMGTTVVGAWCVRLPFAYITGILLGGGILWVWIAMILDWVVRAGALLWRYRREKSFLS